MSTDTLFDEAPLVVSPKLAKIIGLNEAIILQQLHYWLQKNPKFKDDRRWIYNSISEWREQFPFYSISTIRRTLEKLTADGVVIKGDYSKTSFNKTSWWTIDYEALAAIVKFRNSICINDNSICSNWTNGDVQNEQMDMPKMNKCIKNTETSTEITTEITNKERKKAAAAPSYDDIISDYTADTSLRETLYEFIKMRKLIKSPMTSHALQMLLAKLDKMASDTATKIEILTQSIINSYKGIFPLKGENQTSNSQYQSPPKKPGIFDVLNEVFADE